MSDNCCPAPPPSADPRYRRILWIALAVNAAMFLVELAASATSGSAALAADAVDFAGDAANYGLSLAAIAANLWVAWLLYAYREGDANMRSVWQCTRNDAISNLAVLAAAVGVFGTGTFWPDVAVAALMASLALMSAFSVIRHARSELASQYK